MKNKITNLFTSRKGRLTLVLIAFAGIGVYFVIRSFAATPILQGNDGEYIPLQTSVRLIDTRSDGNKAPVPAKQTRSIPVRSNPGIPNDAKAIVVNVTAISPSANGYARIWGGNQSTPNTSRLNYTRGQNLANEMIVPIGASGNVNIWHSAGNNHYQLVVTGYIGSEDSPDGLRLNIIDQTRLIDTRNSGNKAPVAAQQPRSFSVRSNPNIPADAQAVVVNVTAVGPTTNGYARIWGGSQPMPSVSRLNYTRSQNVSNELIVPVGASGNINIWHSAGNNHYVLDITGYYAPEGPNLAKSQFGRTVQITPFKAIDTRDNGGQPVGPNSTRNVTVLGYGTSVPNEVQAVIVNITAITPTANGYTRVYTRGEPVRGTNPDGSSYVSYSQPGIATNTSKLNFRKGQNVANEVVVPVNSHSDPNLRSFDLYNSGGSTHYQVVVTGYITADPGFRTSYSTRLTNSLNTNEAILNTNEVSSPAYTYNEIEYSYIVDSINTSNSELLYGAPQTSIGPGVTVGSGSGHPPGIKIAHQAKTGSKREAVIESAVSVDYCSVESDYMECEWLHPGVRDNYFSNPNYKVIVLTMSPGTEYRFKRQLEVDAPGRPGVWELISLTHSGRTEQLVRINISDSSQPGTVRYTGGLSISDGGGYYKTCKYPEPYSWRLSNVVADGQPIVLDTESLYNPFFSGHADLEQDRVNLARAGACPGRTKINFNASGLPGGGVFSSTIGVLPTERDTVSPTIVDAKIVNGNLRVDATDNSGIVAIEARSIVGTEEGEAGSLRTHIFPVWPYTRHSEYPVNRTQNFNIATYDDLIGSYVPLPSGSSHPVLISVTDNSGNTTEEIRTVTIP